MSPVRKRKILLLLNARAAEDEYLAEAVEELRGRGHVIDAVPLEESGHARRAAAAAARKGYGAVVAAGGDGTLNEVVNGACGARPPCPVGVLPYGTANDFATGCGIADLPRFDQLLLVAEGEPTPIDVGRAVALGAGPPDLPSAWKDGEQRLFVNVASGGFGAEVTADTPGVLKDLLGGLAYSLTGLAKALTGETRTARIRAPDLEYEGPLLLLAVCNGRLAGGGYQVGPRAELTDGLLDVLLIPSVGLLDLPDLFAGALIDGEVHTEEAHVFRTPWLEVESDLPIPVNLDGEPIAARGYRFELIPGRLPFFLPPRVW